ncbi:MAG: hypothetical protein AAF387_04905 [Pseudomonadota bacterium]
MRVDSKFTLPAFMFGSAILGYLLATAVSAHQYAERLAQHEIAADLVKTKSHMTTILQLNDCFINEAFYTLDREIFTSKKRLETMAQSPALKADIEKAQKVLNDYYERFGLHSTCEDCVPRSPMPVFDCTNV